MSYGYKKLDVWNKAYQMTLRLYRITTFFPKEEKFGLISQMRRASFSIIGNLAEGYNKNYLKEYIHSVTIAIGSCNELEVYLMLSKDLHYLKEKEFEILMSFHKDVGKMLFGLRTGLRKKLIPNKTRSKF